MADGDAALPREYRTLLHPQDFSIERASGITFSETTWTRGKLDALPQQEAWARRSLDDFAGSGDKAALLAAQCERVFAKCAADVPTDAIRADTAAAALATWDARLRAAVVATAVQARRLRADSVAGAHDAAALVLWSSMRVGDGVDEGAVRAGVARAVADVEARFHADVVLHFAGVRVVDGVDARFLVPLLGLLTAS